MSTLLRRPLVVILAGCLISLVGFGARSSFGLFLEPMTGARGCAGSYDLVWWAGVVLSLLATAIHLPIDERPVVRPAVKATLAT